MEMGMGMGMGMALWMITLWHRRNGNLTLIERIRLPF